VAGGSSLVEPWYDSSLVVAAGFPAVGTQRPGQPLRATGSMLAVCATVAPCRPRGKRGPETAPPPPRRSGCRLASNHVALRGDARSPSALRSRRPRVLTRALTASRCWRARSVRVGGRWGVSNRCGGGRSWPGRPPRTKFFAVGDAHEVAVPRGLKGQASKPNFEAGWEGVRAAHGRPLAAVLGANHHREGWWELIFSARPPTWRANCRCGM
jgi:hypothetical protein